MKSERSGYNEMRDDATQKINRESAEEDERSKRLRDGGLLDIDEIMEVAGFSQDARDWVLEGRSSRGLSENIELPGRINSRVRSWLRLRENNDRDYMLDRLTQVPGYMFVSKMR